ncbi:MAG: hypothetical protein NT124_03740 [Candidatus Dependentiae bacterium]|nr:hypothetical protein [Candidatus Dependentiae bacterium]
MKLYTKYAVFCVVMLGGFGFAGVRAAEEQGLPVQVLGDIDWRSILICWQVAQAVEAQRQESRLVVYQAPLADAAGEENANGIGPRRSMCPSFGRMRQAVSNRYAQAVSWLSQDVGPSPASFRQGLADVQASRFGLSPLYSRVLAPLGAGARDRVLVPLRDRCVGPAISGSTRFVVSHVLLGAQQGARGQGVSLDGALGRSLVGNVGVTSAQNFLINAAQGAGSGARTMASVEATVGDARAGLGLDALAPSLGLRAAFREGAAAEPSDLSRGRLSQERRQQRAESVGHCGSADVGRDGVGIHYSGSQRRERSNSLSSMGRSSRQAAEEEAKEMEDGQQPRPGASKGENIKKAARSIWNSLGDAAEQFNNARPSGDQQPEQERSSMQNGADFFAGAKNVAQALGGWGRGMQGLPGAGQKIAQAFDGCKNGLVGIIDGVNAERAGGAEVDGQGPAHQFGADLAAIRQGAAVAVHRARVAIATAAGDGLAAAAAEPAVGGDAHPPVGLAPAVAGLAVALTGAVNDPSNFGRALGGGLNNVSDSFFAKYPLVIPAVVCSLGAVAAYFGQKTWKELGGRKGMLSSLKLFIRDILSDVTGRDHDNKNEKKVDDADDSDEEDTDELAVADTSDAPENKRAKKIEKTNAPVATDSQRGDKGAKAANGSVSKSAQAVSRSISKSVQVANGSGSKSAQAVSSVSKSVQAVNSVPAKGLFARIASSMTSWFSARDNGAHTANAA